jgi:hypothetical protein
VPAAVAAAASPDPTAQWGLTRGVSTAAAARRIVNRAEQFHREGQLWAELDSGHRLNVNFCDVALRSWNE